MLTYSKKILLEKRYSESLSIYSKFVGMAIQIVILRHGINKNVSGLIFSRAEF